MEKYSLEMYNVLEKIYGWLMKDAEIFTKPAFIIRLFDEIDDLLCRIRCEVIKQGRIDTAERKFN